MSADELIADLENRPDNLAVINRLAFLEAKEAIPALKDAFKKVDGKREKQVIASALVSLGEPDQTYLDYLIQYAKIAIESDMPYPLMTDSEGKFVRGKFSPKFIKWSEAHGIKPEEASWQALFEFPGDALMLAKTADPRAKNLLIRGLQSKNYSIVSNAAQGLARLQDKGAIKLIIDRCKRSPSEAATAIARSLVFFEDQEAQSAAEQFIQNKRYLDLLRKKAKEKGPKGVFD